MTVSLHIGSIFEVEAADAIVNPANGHLRHGGGLASIIERAATAGVSDGFDAPTELESYDAVARWYADHRAAPLVATGDAYVTSAGLLPYKGVIHAVGPIWGGGCFLECELLGMAMQSACEKAADNGWHHIVCPAISCGIFGFPVEAAARVLVDAALYHDSGIDVTFAVMPEHEDAFRCQLDEPLFTA